MSLLPLRAIFLLLDFSFPTAFLFFSFAFFITAAAFLMALHSVFRSHGFPSSMLPCCFVRFIIVIPLFLLALLFFITQNFSFISLRCCLFIAATPFLVSLRCYKRDTKTYNHGSRKSEKSTLHAYFWKRQKDTVPRYAVINESPSPCVPKLAQIASFNPRNACTLALDLFYDV